jgi:hypothetical protein
MKYIHSLETLEIPEGGMFITGFFYFTSGQGLVLQEGMNDAM